MNTTLNYYELEPENSIFQDVMVDVTHRCNMTCKNCYIPNRNIPDMDIDRMIDAISRFPHRTMIRVVGAEPTMRRDLGDILRRIKQAGHRSTLLTNGLRLANDDYVKHLKQNGLTHVYLSLNGADNDDWYEKIDELRCAKKKVTALENLVNNKIIIDTGTIVVKGINDNVISHLLNLYDRVGAKNVISHIKNIGSIGRNMADQSNYTFEELITLTAQQTGLSEEYIYSWRNENVYKKSQLERDNFVFPLDPLSKGKLVHKSGIWFKMVNWEGYIPQRDSAKRGRLTPDFKVAPFFEHVKQNEFGY